MKMLARSVYVFVLIALAGLIAHAADETAAKVRKDVLEILVRVALMKEHRLGDGHGDFQLGDECGALRGGRREISKIIQPAFADGNHLGQRQEVAQLGAPRRIEALCMMGVHAGRARDDHQRGTNLPGGSAGVPGSQRRATHGRVALRR